MTSDSGVLVYASVMIDGKTKVNYRVYEGGLVEFAIGPVSTAFSPPNPASRTSPTTPSKLSMRS